MIEPYLPVSSSVAALSVGGPTFGTSPQSPDMPILCASCSLSVASVRGFFFGCGETQDLRDPISARIVTLHVQVSAKNIPRHKVFLAGVVACRLQRLKAAMRQTSTQIDQMILGSHAMGFQTG